MGHKISYTFKWLEDTSPAHFLKGRMEEFVVLCILKFYILPFQKFKVAYIQAQRTTKGLFCVNYGQNFMNDLHLGLQTSGAGQGWRSPGFPSDLQMAEFSSLSQGSRCFGGWILWNQISAGLPPLQEPYLP